MARLRRGHTIGELDQRGYGFIDQQDRRAMWQEYVGEAIPVRPARRHDARWLETHRWDDR